MHELSIAENIFKIIENNLSKYNFTKVKGINLKIGKLTAIVPSSLFFAFEILSKGTKFEGAKININEVPIMVLCKKCGKESIIESYDFCCPVCKFQDTEIISGRELYIEDVEIE